MQVQRAALPQPGRRQACLLGAGAPRVRQPLPCSPTTSITGWRRRLLPASQCPVHNGQTARCASEPCGAPAVAARLTHPWPERLPPAACILRKSLARRVPLGGAGHSGWVNTVYHQVLAVPLTRLCADEVVLSVSASLRQGTYRVAACVRHAKPAQHGSLRRPHSVPRVHIQRQSAVDAAAARENLHTGKQRGVVLLVSARSQAQQLETS